MRRPSGRLRSQLVDGNALLDIQSRRPGPDARLQRIDQGIVVEPVDPLPLLVEGTLLVGTGQPQIGNQRLTGPVDHTTDDGDIDGSGDVFQPLLEGIDGANHIKLLTGAGGTGDEVDAARADAQGLEDIEADLDLLD